MPARLLIMLAVVVGGCDRLAPSRVAVSPDTASGEVAFELAGAGGAALMVPLRINGRGPFDFILDTGATVTCVDERLATALALPDVPGGIGIGAGVGGQGALRLVAMDSLTLGSATAYDLHACVVDLEHLAGLDLDVDGLVGLNFLREFHVTLDFERNVLTLADPARVD
ncbi:MAG TPA: retropepsin-like aspartic protease [Longimicrobiales bacterium]